MCDGSQLDQAAYLSLPETFKRKRSGVESRCLGRACNPHMGNLAQGRVLRTQSVCGSNSSEPYCFYRQTAVPRGKESCVEAKCGKCSAAVPSQAHPPPAMSDSSFRYPDTWWQSAEGVKEETLRLSLETEFLFTHLILVFRSPRPAAMVLERSQDFGHTWKTLRYFARDCEQVFGQTEGSPVGDSGATCTSKYSAAYPCTRGEVSRVTGLEKCIVHNFRHICHLYNLFLSRVEIYFLFNSLGIKVVHLIPRKPKCRIVALSPKRLGTNKQ